MPLRHLFRKKRQKSGPSQLQSPLLGKLPAELRIQIFEDVLTVHPAISIDASDDSAPVQYLDHIEHRYGGSKTKGGRRQSHVCGLLFTCSQAYQEGAAIFYSRNTFLMHSCCDYGLITKNPAWSQSVRYIKFYWLYRDCACHPGPFCECLCSLEQWWDSELHECPHGPTGRHEQVDNGLGTGGNGKGWMIFREAFPNLCFLQIKVLTLPYNVHLRLDFIRGERQLLAPLKDALNENASGEFVLTWPSTTPGPYTARRMLGPRWDGTLVTQESVREMLGPRWTVTSTLDEDEVYRNCFRHRELTYNRCPSKLVPG